MRVVIPTRKLTVIAHAVTGCASRLDHLEAVFSGSPHREPLQRLHLSIGPCARAHALSLDGQEAPSGITEGITVALSVSLIGRVPVLFNSAVKSNVEMRLDTA